MLQHKKCIIFCILRKSNSSLFNIDNSGSDINLRLTTSLEAIDQYKERKILDGRRRLIVSIYGRTRKKLRLRIGSWYRIEVHHGSSDKGKVRTND